MKTYINGHCIEQVLTNAVELTQAQYNALPTAQKNVGTYIITDAEAPNISASNVSYDMGSGVTTDVQSIINSIDNRVGFKWIGDTNSSSHSEIDKVETGIKVSWINSNYGCGISGFAIIFSAAFTTGWCAQFMVTCQDEYTRGIASRICNSGEWGTWKKATFS